MVTDSTTDEATADRDIYIEWLREHGVSTQRVVRAGSAGDGKGTKNKHVQYEPDHPAVATDDARGSYAGRGADGNGPYLIWYDVDDYAKFASCGAADAIEADGLPHFRSAHATPGDDDGHYPVLVDDEDVIETIQAATGKKNPSPSWGSIRAHNEFVIETGSRIHCTDDDCPQAPHEAEYGIDRLTDDPFRDIQQVIDSACADGSYPKDTDDSGGSQTPDIDEPAEPIDPKVVVSGTGFDFHGRLDHAEGVMWGEDWRLIMAGEYDHAAYVRAERVRDGELSEDAYVWPRNDRSALESHIAGKLSWLFGGRRWAVRVALACVVARSPDTDWKLTENGHHVADILARGIDDEHESDCFSWGDGVGEPDLCAIRGETHEGTGLVVYSDGRRQTVGVEPVSPELRETNAERTVADEGWTDDLPPAIDVSAIATGADVSEDTVGAYLRALMGRDGVARTPTLADDLGMAHKTVKRARDACVDHDAVIVVKDWRERWHVLIHEAANPDPDDHDGDGPGAETIHAEYQDHRRANAPDTVEAGANCVSYEQENKLVENWASSDIRSYSNNEGDVGGHRRETQTTTIVSRKRRPTNWRTIPPPPIRTIPTRHITTTGSERRGAKDLQHVGFGYGDSRSRRLREGRGWKRPSCCCREQARRSCRRVGAHLPERNGRRGQSRLSGGCSGRHRGLRARHGAGVSRLGRGAYSLQGVARIGSPAVCVSGSTAGGYGRQPRFRFGTRPPS